MPFFSLFLIFFISLFEKSCFIIRYEPSVSSSFRSSFHLSTVHQTEDVVEDEVASLTVGQEMEGLGVVHGLLLFIDLKHRNSNSKLANLASSARI